MSNGWGNNQGGWGQQQGQQQQPRERKVVGRWTAYENNEKPGSTIECELIELPTQKGGKFTVAEFYKPYESKKPEDIANGRQWKRSFGVSFPHGIKQLIDRVNWLIARFGTEKGMYVFMPSQIAPQYGYQPQQQPPVNWGPPPQAVQGYGPQGGPGQINYGQQAAPVQHGVFPPVNQWGPPPQQQAPQQEQQPQPQQGGWNAGPKW